MVTAAIMNEAVRDNFRYLKGIGQIPTISSGLAIDNTDGDEYFKLPRHTTAECASVLSASSDEAQLTFDETIHRIKYYGASLEKVLCDDDILDIPTDSASTQAISANWAYDFTHVATSAGDILYATSVAAFARLGIGTAGQFLQTATTGFPKWGNGSFQTKALNFTRSFLSAETVDQVCSGYGFTPRSINIIFHDYIGAGTGQSDSSTDYYVCINPTASANPVIGGSGKVIAATNGSNTASVKSFDADGFTLAWAITLSTAELDTCSFCATAIG